MPSLQEILADPNYTQANEATKRAIFDKYAGQDPNYAQANDATRSAIRQKFGLNQPVQKKPEEPVAQPKRERTWGEAATDVPASLISGIGSLVQLPGQLYGLATGNFNKTGALGLGEDIQKYGEEMKSAPLKAMEEARAKKIQEAEKNGQLSAAGTAFAETVKSPTLLASFLLEQVPQIIPALISGGGTAALTATGIGAKEAATLVSSGMAKEAAEIAAKKIAAEKAGQLGTKVAVGTGAVQQGADIGAGTYENTYKEMIDRGVPAPEAAQKALNLARAAGASGAIISLLAQRLPGARTLEETLSGVSGKSGRLLGGAKGALGEGASEVAEEVGGKFTQNLAMREVNPEQSLTEGLGQAAGMAAIGGVGMGGVSGLAQKPEAIAKNVPEVKPPDKVPNIEPPVRPPQAPTAKVTLSQEDLDALQNYTQGLPDTAGDVFQRLQNRDRATPASIQQMQSISANPDYDRLKTSADLGSGAPVVISDIDIPANQMGRVDIVTGSDGRKIPVQYAVIDADQLLTSHTADGRTNEDYGNVTTPAIRAVAGNGRIAGLQAAYGLDTAGDYRTALSYDNQHGIDQGAILDMGKPVLVRVMPKSFVTPDIGDVSNVAGQLRLNPVEAAKNDGNRFDLNGLQFNEDGGINTQSLIQFVRGMPKEEQGELMDNNGMPNTTAIDRLNNAIFYKAYGSDSLINLYAQAADPEAKLILAALAKAASKVAKLDGAGEYDIRPNIIEATELAVNAKRNGLKLQDIVKQGNLGMDPKTMAILQMYADNFRSGKRMGELIGNLADSAYEQSQAGEDMFGQKPKVPVEDIFKVLKGEEGGPDLFTQPKEEEPKEEKQQPKGYQITKPAKQIEKELVGKDINEAAQWCIDNAPNSFAKAIAQAVANRIKAMTDAGVPISFEVLTGSKRKTGVRTGFRGVSVVKGNEYENGKQVGVKIEVYINGTDSSGKFDNFSGVRYSTILHELLHTATQPQTWVLGRWIDAIEKQAKKFNKAIAPMDQSELQRELTPLLTKIRKSITDDIKNGKDHPFLKNWTHKQIKERHTSNTSELISYGLTEEDFQDYLSTIKFAEGKSVFTELVTIIRKLLGLSEEYQSALERLVEVTEKGLGVPVGQLQQEIKKTGLTKLGTATNIQIATKTTPKKTAAPTLKEPTGFDKNKPYVTQEEIIDMQHKAYDELSKTEEFKKSQQRIKDAQEESNKRFDAVVKESVRLLKENPQFENALGSLSESVIYNIAMAYRGQAEKNVPALKLSEHDAIVAQNKLIEDFYKRKNIPEPSQFSRQANQDRDYYSDPRFKKWFGQSKAVNRNGKPFVGFHTTDKNFGIFNVGQNIKERTNNPNYTGKLGSWFTAPSLYGREYEEGNAENAVSFSEGKEGDNTMLVHLSIQNPMEYDGFEELQDDRDSYPSVDKFRQALIENGYDGVVVRNSMTDGNVDRDDWVAFYPTQIKSAISNNGEFSVESNEIDRSLPDNVKKKISTALQKRPPLKPESFEGVPDDFMNAANPVFAPQKKTIIDRINGMRDNFWRRLAQGMADQFRTIKEYSPVAYMLARLSKSVDGALEGLMMHGEVFNDGGALNIKPNTKGLIEILKPLGNEVDRFNMWKALTRESQLPADKRSRFINEQGKDVMPKLVAERDKLIEGDIDGKPRKQVYEQVRKDMQKLNESVLKVALDAGLIDSTAKMIERIRDQISFIESKENLSDNAKEKQIQELEDKIADLKKNPIGFERFVNDINYIPFYREMEDGDIDAVMTASSLTNQHFSKALKGGESPFADLMENTLRNWSHILSASMKAQAAHATIEAAIPLGGAEPNLKQQFVMIDGLVNVITRKKDEDGNTYESAEVYKDGKIEPWMTTPASGKSGKSSIKIMVDGSPAYYNVLDPMLLDSISSIGYLGPKSKFLDVARDFKNMLQFGVTISPAFKVRNLIRDSIQAMAVSDLKKNPFANIADGWVSSDKNNPAHISALAGGGVFTFGTHVEGDQAKLVKRLVAQGVKEEHILDTPDKIKKGLQIAFDKYQEWGNKSEAANRMALYNQMVAKGMSHLEASYYARDLLDFSMSGSWPAFRQVCQVVPFLNARVQGLYKLGRDGIMPTSRVFYNTITGQPIDQTDQQKAASFSIVTSAVCLASLALYFAFKDDDEFKKRDEWDRDNFWWFKLPGMDYALRVPKPFEIGAFGTIAERVAEHIFDEGAEGKQFQQAMGRMVTDTFAVNLPQFVKPLVDLYANKDSFTGAPIESAGMERLSKQERATDTTSPLAKLLGGISSITGEGLSPVQMDYAIKAYFGWLGSAVAESSHYAVMPFKDGSYPDTKIIDKLSVGLVKSLPSNQSKYPTAFYESNKQISQALADMRHYAEIGEADKVRKILEEQGDKIALSKFYDKTAKNMAKIRQHISVVTNDPNMDGATKREEIDRLKELISMLAEQAEQTRKSMKP
jgi:hypothetical protein